MILFLALITATAAFPSDPFSFGFGKTFPPYGIPAVAPAAEKELEIEEIVKKLSMDKSWPFDKEISTGLGIGKEFEYKKDLEFTKELEFEKELASLSKIAGFEKAIGLEKSYFEKATPFPWALYEKYFGLSKKLTFEQAMLFELYKQYGYYGLWVARELQRRFAIAKELGLIGRDIAFQEAISLGLFKGIGLEKIFEAVNKAIGVEKAFEFDKVFGSSIFKKF